MKYLATIIAMKYLATMVSDSPCFEDHFAFNHGYLETKYNGVNIIIVCYISILHVYGGKTRG